MTLGKILKGIGTIFLFSLLISSCMSSDSDSKNNDQNSKDKIESKEEKKENDKTSSQSKISSQTSEKKDEDNSDKERLLKKLPENSVVSGAKELNKRGQFVVLNSGKWVVGKNINPGHYQITATSGRGNITGDTKLSLNIMLSAQSDSDNMYLSKYDTYLFEGDSIDISGLQGVKFTPIKTGSNIDSGELNAGNYVVGLDIKPGRYKIKAVAGNGNLIVEDGSVNEMLGTDTADGMYVNETTQELEKGQVLSTTLNAISLVKED